MSPSGNIKRQKLSRAFRGREKADADDCPDGLDRWLVEVKRRDWTRSPSRRLLDAWTQSLARAILRDDVTTLAAAEEVFGTAQARWYNEMSDNAEDGEILGRLRGLVALIVFGLEVSVPRRDLPELEPESLGTRFLSSLATSGDLNSSDLARLLRIDPTEVSRTGSRLLNLELVSRHRLGRRSLWRLTPRGRESLRVLSEERVVDPVDPQHPAVALLVWGQAARREVKRQPSSFSQALKPVDLLADIIDDKQGRLKLGATLCMSASVQRFASSRELAFEVTYRRGRPPEETGWESLRERFDRKFDFESFWPSSPPAWHAHAFIRGDDNRLGVLLIDVPESPKQIISQESRIKRQDHVQLARDALYEAVKAFDLPRKAVPEEARYSDLLRRLVLIHYLRSHCEIPAWSARMCFVASRQSTRLPHTPSSQDAWEAVLERARQEAFLSPSSLADWNQLHFVPVDP